MEFRRLRYFVAVADAGNFHRAAEQLRVAQSALSRHIRELERETGIALLERLPRGVRPTDAGRLLYATCEEMFAALTRVEDRFADLRGLKAGRLRLAVSTTGKYFAPRMLAAFVQKHPGVDVALQIHNRQALIERLNNNADDLYIFANPPQDIDVVTQMILPNPLVAYANADHPLARERRIPFARFAAEPFLIREPGSGTRMIVQQIFDQHGVKPNIRMELGSNEAIKQAILAGLGVSIMSRYNLGLDTENDRLATLDVKGLPIEGHWYFVYPVGKQPTLVAQSFMEFVRTEGKQLVVDHLAPQ